MKWALVDRAANTIGSASDLDAVEAQEILARLPADCREELCTLLREACGDGRRRRLGVTRPDHPLLVVDIVPLRARSLAEPPALIVLYEASEFDSAADRVRRLARRNEAILRCAMDGFFVVDEDCRFLEVNEAFCRMVGYPADELYRMRITDLEVTDGGVPAYTQTGLHQFPTAHRHKHGHVVHLEISINVLHDAGSKILVGFARDVTERLRAEAELARLNHQQQLILSSAGEGIAGLDPAGRISFVNPTAAGLLGMSPEQLVGQDAHTTLLGRDTAAADCAAADCPVCAILRHGQRVVRRSGEFPRPDGRRVPVDYSLTAMLNGGTAAGAVLVFKDVTEQRRAEEERRLLEAQVLEAQKLESLGLLAGGIAHDLNNMLTGIQGNASLVMAQLPPDAAMRGRVQRIVGACDRASKVVNQVLAYAGRVVCEASPQDLNTLVSETVELMRSTLPTTARLTLELARALPSVEADPGQLQQVITNLLVNAVEALPEQTGHISIATSQLHLGDDEARRAFPGQNLAPGDYVCLEVADTGCGMKPETLARIFEPFYSTKNSGRGLGLAAMRGVVRAHRGGVRVESTPGQGTLFTLAFPVLDVSAPAVPATTGETCPGREATVLVIDDEFDVRDVIQDILTTHGFRVLTAENGRRGIEVFRQHADVVDIVLLDMKMPDLGGREVYRELRRIRPDARVIVISGYSDEIDPLRFGEPLPAAFLGKPFIIETMIERIRAVLRQPAAR
jgi:two-component system cell cycle sensor histidine kinase/response regulator CckA